MGRVMQKFLDTSDWRSQVKNVLSRWLILGTVAATVFSLTGYLGTWHLYLELTSHFKVQYLAIACVGLIFFALNRRKLLILVSLFCIALNLAVIVPWYIPQSRAEAATTSGEQVRVLLANVLTSNRRYSEVVSLIESENPDIAVFLEVNEVWAKELKALQKNLPFSLDYPREDNFGIALYSKLPLQKPRIEFFTNEDVASILAEIPVKDKIISAIATHPLPPTNPEYFDERNKQLEKIAKYVKQLKNHALVIGDLNVTVWSPYYKNFVEISGLHNVRAGFGVLPTWPTQSPLLYIPLDHCLVSPEIKVLQARTGRNIGSDHLPLIADLLVF